MGKRVFAFQIRAKILSRVAEWCFEDKSFGWYWKPILHEILFAYQKCPSSDFQPARN